METSFRTSRPQRYLYAMVEGLPGWWRPPREGVGAGAVTARPVRDLFLIASPIVSPPGRTPGAQARHHDVVGSLLEATSVVPFRFATVVPEMDIDGWLDARMPLIRTSLAEVRGCVEMTVRLLRLDPRIERSPGANGVAGFLRIVADRLIERAGLPNWRYCPTGSGGNAAASLAFLVPRADISVFLAHIAPIAARAEGVAVVPTGPWPPYSFLAALERETAPTAGSVSA
ncbi:MAG: hypothetical protein AUH29_01260 [Candidatus Rokubacteria bacterium 13_1_40CM_69_27]|nr:MAG: hypothetical protein AUH29_01260 [Candidatus Rokubacteria bacterium 13_1_40CM_69_27]